MTSTSASGAKAQRIRLDQLLVERGLAESRSRAQALVLAGKVRVGEGDAARLDRKAGDLVDPATTVSVDAPEPYVSRGGHKLAAALDAFGIDPRAWSASTSAPRPAASPTCCCSAARPASTLSTWDAASSPTRSAATPASSRWSAPTPGR